MGSRIDPWLVLALAVAFAIRGAVAPRTPGVYIEMAEFIPRTQSSSWEHSPIRDYQHADLPAYLIRLGGWIFGSTLAEA